IKPFMKEAYGEAYAQDKYFGVKFQKLQSQGDEKKGIEDYYLKDRLLYRWGKLYVPKEERLLLMREAHTSKVVGHFGV
ncbi:hypothetical protein KI387_017195, partial [Taxus chinensis]